MADRRPGDIASCYADAALAERELNWKAKLNLNRMCKYTIIITHFSLMWLCGLVYIFVEPAWTE